MTMLPWIVAMQLSIATQPAVQKSAAVVQVVDSLTEHIATHPKLKVAAKSTPSHFTGDAIAKAAPKPAARVKSTRKLAPPPR